MIISLTKEKECKSYKDILTSYEMFMLNKNIIPKFFISDEPIITTFDKTATKFYTITFSSKRFFAHTDQQYIDYIYYQLHHLYSTELASFIYGCFEHHKSGIIHAHVIITSYQHDMVNKYLNQKFNHDARNRFCIDSSYVKSEEKVLNYIYKKDTKEKRSNEFFKIGVQLDTPPIILDVDPVAISSHKGYCAPYYDD